MCFCVISWENLLSFMKYIFFHINKEKHQTNCTVILTVIILGLMKNQHALHHSQKQKLFLPSIISMSLIKRFPPGNIDRRQEEDEVHPDWIWGITNIFPFVPFTVYVDDANNLQQDQNKKHPCGNELVDQRHPVYSCLTYSINTEQVDSHKCQWCYCHADLPVWHTVNQGEIGKCMWSQSERRVYFWTL